METRHLKLKKFKVLGTILLASLILCRGGDHDKQPKVEILDSPPPTIRALSGSTVEMMWRFRVRHTEKLKFTSWYQDYSAESNIKDNSKIIRKNHTEGGEMQHAPYLLAEKINRTKCSFTLVEMDWIMRCHITNVNVGDSFKYGIEVEIEGDQGTAHKKTNSSSLEVVDIMLNREESDVILESWIGKETVLNCAILRKINLTTCYEWSGITEEKDITRGIGRSPTKTWYRFVPQTARDFGKYRCTISTASSTVEHVIELKQFHYTPAPKNLKVSSKEGEKIELTWERPSGIDGNKIIKYKVQAKNKRGQWERVGETAKLKVVVDKIDQSAIRVCSIDKAGIGPESCSKSKDVPTGQPQRGNSGSLFTIPSGYLWMLWFLGMFVI